MKIQTCFITVVFLFILTSSITAQKKYSFALKGGINKSKQYTEIDKGNLEYLYTSSRDKSMTDYDLGLTFEYYFLAELSLYTSLELSFRKSEIHLENELFPLTINTTRNYIQMPIHASYTIKEISEIYVFIHGGPYIAYGISGKIKFDGFPTYLDGNQSFNYFKRFDVGIGGGLKIEYHKFGIDAGYNQGLINIDKTYGMSIKNQCFYLALLIKI